MGDEATPDNPANILAKDPDAERFGAIVLATGWTPWELKEEEPEEPAEAAEGEGEGEAEAPKKEEAKPREIPVSIQ